MRKVSMSLSSSSRSGDWNEFMALLLMSMVDVLNATLPGTTKDARPEHPFKPTPFVMSTFGNKFFD